MEFEIEVRIELKKGVMDAEGETIEKSLDLLGYDMKRVESIKAYNITVDANHAAIMSGGQTVGKNAAGPRVLISTRLGLQHRV